MVIDKLKITAEGQPDTEDMHRLRRSVDKAMQVGNGLMMALTPDKPEVRFFSRNLMDATTGLSYSEPAPHSFSFNTGAPAAKVWDVSEQVIPVHQQNRRN